MIKELQELLERAQTWPEVAQEELTQMARKIEEELKGSYCPTVEEMRAIDEAACTESATDEEVEAAFRSFRRI